jgi:hypothetical protein
LQGPDRSGPFRITTNWSYQSVLCHVAPAGIRDLHELAHSHRPYAMKDQGSLLFAGLDFDKADGRPVTASQIAFASIVSFLCRLTCGYITGSHHSRAPYVPGS